MLDEEILTLEPESKNGEAELLIARTKAGQRLFVKTQNNPDHQGLLCEAQGLSELKSAGALVPELHHASLDLLVIAEVPHEAPTPTYWRHLAQTLARVHQHQEKSYGFAQDNWLGAALQKNDGSLEEDLSWGAFFWKYRIHYKINNLAMDKGARFNSELIKKLEEVCLAKLESFSHRPSLLHGDLWSGNVLCGPEQRAHLIDPAIYYGDREADIAMTQCFGGFAPEFYQAYDEDMPLEAGYEQRRHLYNLYHMLNHWEIFGSTYEGVARQMIEDITA